MGNKHRYWTEEDWKKVLRTDKLKFEMFASQTGTFVRCRANANMLEECSTPSVKDGGVLVTPCEWHLIRVNFLLQQDNDPKHSSKLCKNYLGKKQSAGIVSIMEWPVQ